MLVATWLCIMGNFLKFVLLPTEEWHGDKARTGWFRFVLPSLEGNKTSWQASDYGNIHKHYHKKPRCYGCASIAGIT